MFTTLQRLLQLGEHYKNNSRLVSAGEVTKIIRRQFPAADYSFRTYRDPAVNTNMIVVSGFYDHFCDIQSLPHIEVSLTYCPGQTEYELGNLNWEQLSFDIAECIGHEKIHKRQHRKREKLKPYQSKSTDLELKKEQEYLGDESEIDAYGFSIAYESTVFNKDLKDCAMYNLYKKVFDKDNSVLLKLENRISKYLIQLEPYYEQTNRS